MLLTFQNLRVAMFHQFPRNGCILHKFVKYLSTATFQGNFLPIFQRLHVIAFRYMGRDSSVSTTTRYGPDGPQSYRSWGGYFPHWSRLALDFTQPTVQWVPDILREQDDRGAALTTQPH